MADVYTRIGYIKGATGAQGAQGVKGDTGDAATIAVGTVTTVPYGQTANVVNSGTSGAAVFDFTIPQGKPGEQTTDMQNLTIGSITTSSASFPVPTVGETGKVLWGKVVKWFSDMSALVATKLNAANVVANLTTSEIGYALDATQGTLLADTLTNMIKAISISATTNQYGEFYLLNGSSNLNVTNSVPLVAYDANGHAYTFKRSGSTTDWLAICSDNRTGLAVANTSITCYLRFLNYPITREW